MFKTLLFFSLSIFLYFSGSAVAGMNCTAPPTQIARDVSNEAEGSANAIIRLGTARVTNRTKVIINNLYEKYPDADRLIIAQALISLTCEALNSSTTLTDKERLEFIRQLRGEIFGTNSIDKENLSDQKEKPKVNTMKNKSKSQENNKSDLDHVRVFFGSAAGEGYNVIFGSGKFRLVNVGSEAILEASLHYNCGGKKINVRANLSPIARASGYSDSDRFVRYFETPLVHLAQNWIDKSNAYLIQIANSHSRQNADGQCKVDMVWNRLYKFTFEDYSGKELTRFHKLNIDLVATFNPRAELSTASKQEWDEAKKIMTNTNM